MGAAPVRRGVRCRGDAGLARQAPRCRRNPHRGCSPRTGGRRLRRADHDDQCLPCTGSAGGGIVSRGDVGDHRRRADRPRRPCRRRTPAPRGSSAADPLRPRPQRRPRRTRPAPSPDRSSFVTIIHAEKDVAEQRSRLRTEVTLAARVLPTHYPLETFIAVNPLAGFENLPFEQAVRRAGDLYGTRGTLTEEAFRTAYRAGRITDADLDQALGRRHPNLLSGSPVRFGDRDVTPAELL